MEDNVIFITSCAWCGFMTSSSKEDQPDLCLSCHKTIVATCDCEGCVVHRLENAEGDPE